MNNGRPNYSNTPAYGQSLRDQRAAGAQGGYNNMGAQPVQPGAQPYPQSYPQGQPMANQPVGQPMVNQPVGQPMPGQPVVNQPMPGARPVAGQTPYGYAPQGQAYPPQGQPYPRQNVPQGYPQQPGYNPQQNAPQGYPPQGYMGGYPQQNPPLQGYPQGYPQQPGYNPQQMYNNGYAQPQQPKKKSLRPDQWAMIVLCGVLPVLFVVSMILGNVPVLKWIFIALTVASVVFLWVKPLVSSNTRLTFSAVYGALAVVALVSILTGTAPADTTTAANNNGTPAVSGTTSNTTSDANNVITSRNDGSNAQDNGATLMLEDVTPTPTAEAATGVETIAQMESFFYFWSVNNTSDMVSLCAPSWVSSVEEPLKALFSILANRTPLDWETEKISGTDADASRTITAVATIDKGNGRDPSKYRFAVMMLKENGVWYVDPRSLSSQEPAEEESTDEATATATVAPASADTAIDPNLVLYYNPDGGSKYHIDQNCSSTAAKFLPFKGSFTYSQISEHSDLTPCNVCNATNLAPLP